MPHPTATTPLEGRIGPAEGSYKRTPALIKQITRLNLNPKVDYFLEPTGKEDFKFDFPDRQAHALFRKCREKAMTTGDRESIAIMTHFLIWMILAERWDMRGAVTPQDILNQMKIEYNFDGLGAAVLEMQERTRRDPLIIKRPCVLNPLPRDPIADSLLSSVLLFGMHPEYFQTFARGMVTTRPTVLDN